MGTISKDLGPVTAYAYAKEGGYTGTATQFEKDLADSANIINTIDEMISDKADLVNGKVPSSQLPSYVDDVIEGYYKQTDGKFYEESTYETEITGETGKIYVDLTTDNSYRWSGSAFVKINDVDVTAKADKVTNATNGNLAGLDANGNITDSGKKPTDFAMANAGVPTGGAKGQVLQKTSDEDYAFEWRESSGGIDTINGAIYEEISIYALEFSSDNNFTLSAPIKWDGTLEYTVDNGNTWNTWDGSQLSGTALQPIYLRGTRNSVISNGNHWTFTGKYCTGNIENLLDYQTVANGEHPVMRINCYGYMFNGCTSLAQAPELPATTLASYCYSNMFYNCTSLTQAPELPATTLASGCYENMFYGCTSLTSAPELPATTLDQMCYQSMFNNCTSLTTPPELPAETLASYCYSNMFYNCTSLTQAPELPATTLASGCYSYIFYNCTSLKLSTTQTEEYQYTYRIPTSGTGTTAEEALLDMFTNTGGTFKGTPTINTTYYLATPTVQQILKYALKFNSDENFILSAPKKWDGTIEFTIDNGNTWNTWDGSQLSGMASQPIYLRGIGNTVITGGDNHWTFTGKYCTGNIENLLDYQTVANGEHPVMGNYSFASLFRGCTSIVTPPDLSATTLTEFCYNYMFADCINLAITPQLPATTLANECYSQMFFACSSLTTVPELPATTLHDKCYRQMFMRCFLIKLSKTQTDEYQYAYRIPTTGTGTDATDALYRMFVSTGGTFTDDPTINTTYYTTNQPV